MNTLAGAPQTKNTIRRTPGLQSDFFCDVENYSWEWPENPALPRALKFAHVYLERCHWSAPLSPSQWGMLEGLTEKIGLQIASALSKPCPVYSKDDSIRIEFLDCLAWVCDKRYRTIYLDFRRPFGSWEKSDHKIDLLKPLDDSRWLDIYMQHWSQWLFSTFGPLSGEASWNIQSTLVHMLRQVPRALVATNRQIKYHLELSPGLISVASKLSLWSPELGVDNETYSFLWKEQESWQNLGAHYPRLAHFYYLLRKEGLLQENANLGGMRARCFELGLNKSGWRFLCRHGEEAYVSFYSDFDDALAPPRELIAYMNWQADAGLDAPLDQLMAKRVHESNCLTLMPDRSCQVLLDPRLAHVAQEVFDLSAKQDRQEWYWGYLRNWRRVLEWIVNEQPVFDRNQFKAGWNAIYRCYTDWIKAKQPKVNWASVLGSFLFDKWWIREMVSSSDLELESLRMHHCAVTYVDVCSAGEYVMFSVEDAENHSPMATIGFKKKSDDWVLDQVRGKFNDDPGPELDHVMHEIQARLSKDT